MNENSNTVRISVRNLVEFILRSGDLDNRTGGKAELQAMQAGSRLHRKIQKRMGAGYRAEVALKERVPMEGFDCILEGRADGIFTEEGLTWIDEIKGVYRELERIGEPEQVHLAQALCYGCIYARQQELQEIGIQMTYGNLETEELKYFRFRWTRADLEDWFGKLMKEYEKWARFQLDWKETCRGSIRSLEFPFPYREGQRELAAGVYRTILRKKRLFIQAPTGVGKTISTVFPAVKAVGEGLGDRIFYLTAKTVARTVAEEAFRILRKDGLRMKNVTLTAKEKLCVCEAVECNPDACPCAAGHYDRINDAVYELLTEGPDEISRDVILEQAGKHQVCPFELSLDTASWTDVIICDYNYVFDPNVRLKRFFGEGVRGDYLFLIDEAHNLVERSREMFSAAVCKEDFLELKRKLKGRDKKTERALERCNRYLLGLKRECETWQLHENVDPFLLQLLSLSSELERLREEELEPELQKEVLEFWFTVRDFLNVADRLSDNYVIYSELDGDGSFQLKLYCVETAENLRECLDKGRAAIFFSATLLPVTYYKHLLGDGEDYAIYVPSPFNRENRLLLLGQDVSSRYTRRNRAEYEKIAGYLNGMVNGKQGNYLAFFPSYRMMQAVYESYRELYGEETELLIQKTGMQETEREAFLDAFRQGGEAAREEKKSLLGFCVLGGIFSEGIDLKGEALIGAAVIGTGLPQICNEREILRQYYEKKEMDGFAYAYRYPGMNKVLQAAGRVIRTDRDAGVILLLDERFREPDYRRMFPMEWEDIRFCRLPEAGTVLQDFWNTRKSIPETASQPD